VNQFLEAPEQKPELLNLLIFKPAKERNGDLFGHKMIKEMTILTAKPLVSYCD